MQLSEHFSLDELTITVHKDVDNSAPPSVIPYLTRLAVEFLEPIRQQFGSLEVTSGYRSPALNKKVKGAPTSSHCFGCAADVHAESATVDEVFAWAKASGLDYDQVIDEYGDDGKRWVHIGMASPLHRIPRKEVWIYKNRVFVPAR